MLLNFCLLVTCAFLVSLTYRDLPVDRRKSATQLRIVLSAVAALLLVATGEKIGPFKFDLRYVPVVLIALRYGAFKGALVALPFVLWRLMESQMGGVVATLNTASVLGLSALVRPHMDLSTFDRRSLWLAPIPFLGLGAGLLISAQGRALFPVLYPGMIGIHVLGLLMAQGVLQTRVSLLRLSGHLRDQVMTDDLTTLGNRRRFDQELACLGVGRHLVLLDVDHFRQLNDAEGHAIGDRALRSIGQHIREEFPNLGFRLSGDSFALLLPAISESAVRQRVEALLTRVKDPGSLPWSSLTLSAGMATRQPDDQPSDLIHCADEALFLAKTNGRGRLVIGHERHRRSEHSAPELRPVVRPRYTLWQAQRTTVGLLSQRRSLTAADWQELLRLAVSTLDGVEAGSLDIRDGHSFRIVAVQGYDAGLLGTQLTEGAQLRWYANSAQDWRRGVPRVLHGPALQTTFREAGELILPEEERRLAQLGGRERIHSSLCVPVLLDGEVVAHLNLDSLSSAGVFTPQVMSETQMFAQQIAALLQLQERWRELELLARLHGELGTDDDQAEIRLVESALELLRAANVTLLRYDPARDVLVKAVDSGELLSPELTAVPRGPGAAWQALETATVIRVTGVQLAEPGRVAAVLRDGQHAAKMVVPLLSPRRGPLGVMVLFRSPHHPFQENEEGLARMLANIGLSVLERSAHVSDLRATLDAALNTLGIALEARDFETQGHTNRVHDLACAMGEALSLPRERLTALSHGAVLHDIGKLCIPDEVLLKPGRLTPEEFQIMQQHAPLGADLADRIPYLHPEAHGVIRHHHERWDGAGYPDRLAGEDIPLLARIFALCDVYDALISERPYKKAMDQAQALRILQEGSGSQFDPQLAPLFISLLDPAAVPDGSLQTVPRAALKPAPPLA